jgi:iron complex outermembrane receptor protein
MQRYHSRLLGLPWRAAIPAVVLALAWNPPAIAQTAAPTQLEELSLEQLRDVVVHTVSRLDERLDRAAASVYVITPEDIRRSGATTIPDALRLAPTLDVARADANQYAISARGFNNVLANKMLVLIDGRTVYTPLFSGVFWEAQDVMLEDVDRIEVVTGPSTALWGSNAVNGLIHIITRPASATQGPAISLAAGNRRHMMAGRQGVPLGNNGFIRGYAKAYGQSGTERTDGSPVNDASHGLQAGFRADWTLDRQAFTLRGDVYRGTANQMPEARRYSGANLLGRWEKTFNDGATLTVQGYIEQTRRTHPQIFEETLNNADFVAEYGFRPLKNHQVLLGAGYRHSKDDLGEFPVLAFIPSHRSMSWSRVFAQDRITLFPRLMATAALSVEKNPFGRTETLPSLRLAWQIDDARLAWASLSRAVRAPSRIDREFFQPAQPPFVVAGGPNFRSEVADVTELGYRAQASASWSYSVTLFQHEHRRLRSIAPTPAGLMLENDIEGRTRGMEAWTRWRASPRWRIDAGLVLLRQELQVRPGGVDVGGLAALGNDPRHWWTLRSALDIAPRVSFDVSMRHVGQRPQPDVPSYTALDARIAWSVTPTTEIALMLQNLADPLHPEWGAPANRVEFGRSALLQLRWRL